MGLVDGISETLFQQALTFLPIGGWALVGLAGFLGMVLILKLTKRPKLVFFGSGLAMTTTFFFVKGFLAIFLIFDFTNR